MDACLFTVADQPWLRETVFGLVDVFLRDGKGIACVEYDGKTGNPCVFSKRYYGELMKLSGDVGGKRVVVAHRGDVAVMKVEDGRGDGGCGFCGRRVRCTSGLGWGFVGGWLLRRWKSAKTAEKNPELAPASLKQLDFFQQRRFPPPKKRTPPGRASPNQTLPRRLTCEGVEG